MKKIYLLNAGTETRNAFKSGVTKHPCVSLKTKSLIVHINQEMDIKFLYRAEVVDFSDSYVFTRLRGTDQHFTGILYEHLVANDIPCSDPINLSFRRSESKISQMTRLVRAGITVPETIIAREESFSKNRDYIFNQISFPMVYKIEGSQGRNVHLVHSMNELEQHLSQKPPHELFLLQAYHPNTFDTRTIVAFGKVLGTIKRSAPTGQFLNNVSQGPTVTGYTLTPHETEVALKAAEACHLDFGGVDMIHTNAEPVVLEVNKSPQIKGFETIYGKQSVFRSIGTLLDESLSNPD